jgi:hypothetical protein
MCDARDLWQDERVFGVSFSISLTLLSPSQLQSVQVPYSFPLALLLHFSSEIGNNSKLSSVVGYI